MASEFELRLLFCDMIDALFRAGAGVEAVAFQSRYFAIYPLAQPHAPGARECALADPEESVTA